MAFTKQVWKTKCPIKIKIFLWLMAKRVILTWETSRNNIERGQVDVFYA